MVRATVLGVGDHAVEGVPDNKGKGEKMALEPPMNSAQRRKLKDITNFPNQKKPNIQGANQQQQAILLSSNENAVKLQKAMLIPFFEFMKMFMTFWSWIFINLFLQENIALKKALMESEVALQKLRINLQKMILGITWLECDFKVMLSWQELNTNKDQLKVLRHELGCRNGLLMAKKILVKEQTLPSEDKTRPNAPGRACKTFQPKGVDHKNASESSNVNSNEKANNRRSSLSLAQSARSETQTENLQQVVDAKEIKEDSRFSLRKRSARLNDQEPEPPESFDESIQKTKRQRKSSISRVSSRRQSPKVKESTDPPLQDEESIQISSSVSMELKRESKNESRGDEAEVMRRPTRQAAEKVQSYREASLKKKMRRSF